MQKNFGRKHFGRNNLGQKHFGRTHFGLCVCLLATAFFAAPLAAGQAKKATTPTGSAPSAASSAAAKICDDPYVIREPAEGWPEAPIQILFHREKSKAPWARNPAIRVPGLEAAAPSAARTLVCVEESRVEMGHYDSGEPGYAPSWGTILVRLSDRKVYFMGRNLDGEMPPQVKYNSGAGVGKVPTEILVRWLRLLLEQKVARFKVRLKWKEYAEVSAMAFSGDNSRLAVAQAPRSSSSGATPPSPLTVFDITTAQPVAAMHADYSTDAIAISKSGSTIATERYGHVEIWDVATGAVTRKLETTNVRSLVFGQDDLLGAAGDEKAAVWDVSGNRIVRSGNGSTIELSPENAWLVMAKGAKGFTVSELESGRELGSFPGCSEPYKCTPSRDGKMMARWYSLGAMVYASDDPEGNSPSLPNLGISMVSAVAPARNGFVIANGDGIAGVVSAGAPEARAFATDLTGIRAIAVSNDGKLVALGDSSGNVEVWELR
ncbi:MAG TPA: WD40 repeat domain-containing protein [Candidatus Angelobacter sp.]|nr:WD40 repeat domain-containing protein [Candidatus Angelobacter sp.]